MITRDKTMLFAQVAALYVMRPELAHDVTQAIWMVLKHAKPRFCVIGW